MTIEFIDHKNSFLTDVKMLGIIKNKACESHTEVEQKHKASACISK